jgi:molecular chaperone GrpE
MSAPIGDLDPVDENAGATEDVAPEGDFPTGPYEVPADDPGTAARERRVLLDLLIYAWDRAKSPGVWQRLATGLADIGVEVIRPDGLPFDPTAHEVGGVEPTTDPALHDTVAETELAGFADRGVVLREPIVVVYRLS